MLTCILVGVEIDSDMGIVVDVGIAFGIMYIDVHAPAQLCDQAVLVMTLQ
jgi:hypothetical protein